MRPRTRDTPTQGQLASIETSDGGATLRLAGDWRLPRVQAAAAALTALPKPARVVAVDGGSLTGLDTAGALVALRYLQRIGAEPKLAAPRNFTPHHQRIIELVARQLAELPAVGKTHPRGFFTTLGRDVVAFGDLLVSYVQFLGYTAAGIGTLVLHPWRLRLKELAAQLQQVVRRFKV